MKSNFGKKILLIYFLVFFIIGGIGYELLGYDNQTYKVVKWDAGLLILFMFSVILPLLFTKKDSNFYGIKNFLSIDLQIIILIILDVIILFYRKNAGFRYSELGVSEMNSGLFMYLYLLTNTILNFFLMIYVFYKPEYLTKYGSKSKLLIILFLIGIIFSINGNATALLALFFVVFLFFPNVFNYIVYKNGKKSIFFYLKFILFLVFIIPLLILTNIYGESKKLGVDFNHLFTEYDLIEYLNGFTKYFFTYVLSPNYVSFKHALVNFGSKIDLNLFISHINVPFDDFIFRFKVFFGLNEYTVKPDISSYSRLNYFNISEFPSDREGTSPGLFASIFLSFPFPINFIVCFLSVKYLINFLNVLVLSMRKQLTIIGLFVYLYFFITPLLASPFDFFIIIDNLSFYVLLFVIFFNYCIQKNRFANPNSISLDYEK